MQKKLLGHQKVFTKNVRGQVKCTIPFHNTVGVGGTTFLLLNEYFYELNPRKNPVLNIVFELNPRKKTVLNIFFELNPRKKQF